MSNKKNDASFLVQGSILAIASIVSRIIGLVYRIPLTNIIGDTGNDYYSCAFEIYSIMLMISSYGIPTAVSKLVSSRLADDQKENAYRIFQGAFLFALVAGVASFLIVFFGAGALTKMFQTPLAYFSLRVLAPCLIIVALLGVIRGFFQGLGTTVPSSISQVVEQIVNAIVSVAAAFVLYGYGARIAGVLGSTNHYAESYGAAGGTLGTTMGAIAGLLFCVAVFMPYRRQMKKAIRKEQGQAKRHGSVNQVESYPYVMKILVYTIIPILLCTTIYNLVSLVDQGVFKNLMVIQGADSDMISMWWGIYSGKYRILSNLPVNIASALATTCVPALAAAYARRDEREVQNKVALAMRYMTIIAMPCTAGFIVLADPIIQLLFPGTDPVGGHLMIAGAVTIILYSISTLSNAILQGVDKLMIPIRNSIIALILNVISLPISIFVFHLNIYAMIVGNIVFSLLMCIMNAKAVTKYSGYRVDVKLTYIRPGIASAIMGVIVFAVYYVLKLVSGHNSIATVVSIVVGIITYFVLLLLAKGITENELYALPKGATLVRIGKKLHLL